MKKEKNILVFIFLCLKTVVDTSSFPSSTQTQCFVDGECRDSYLIEEALTLGENGCLHFCQMVEGCKWFTFHSGQSLCTAMSECKELSNQTCPDCLSGQKECENLENQCWINGLCKGRLIEEIPASSPEECLKVCLTLADCKWFTFDDIMSGCFLMKDCPSLDESCVSCVSSTAKCRGKTSYTKLLVAGGISVTGTLKDVEIIDLETPLLNCENIAQLPNAVEGAVGGITFNNEPLICGGFPYNKDCYVLQDNAWKGFGLMHEIRKEAAIAESPYSSKGRSLFVTGGENEFGNVTKSAEFLLGNKWEIKPDMPGDLCLHCMVFLNSTIAMVIGGWNSHRVSLNATFFYNAATEKWTEGPPLNQQRTAHSCGRIRKNSQSHQFSIIAVGGWSGGGLLSSTEVFDEVAGVWNFGPELPTGVDRAELVEDPTGGVILVGGAIHRLQHAGPDANWIKMPQSLKTERYNHAAFLVSDEYAKCSLL